MKWQSTLIRWNPLIAIFFIIIKNWMRQFQTCSKDLLWNGLPCVIWLVPESIWLKTRRLPADSFGLSGGRWQQQSETKSLYIIRAVSNFMEQKLRFGLVLGRMAVLKKIRLIKSNFWGRFFLYLNNLLNFFKKYYRVRTKELLKMKVKKFLEIELWILKRLQKHIQLCLRSLSSVRF